MRLAALALLALALVTRAGAAEPPVPADAEPYFGILPDGDDVIHLSSLGKPGEPLGPAACWRETGC